MEKKIINGVTYELVASVSNNKLCLGGREFFELRLEFKNDYLSARPGWDKICKGLALARFTLEHNGYFYAADDYEEVLSEILRCETCKRPKYKKEALMCALMIAQRYSDTDVLYDEKVVENVKKFYADKFPLKSFDK